MRHLPCTFRAKPLNLKNGMQPLRLRSDLSLVLEPLGDPRLLHLPSPSLPPSFSLPLTAAAPGTSQSACHLLSFSRSSACLAAGAGPASGRDRRPARFKLHHHQRKVVRVAATALGAARRAWKGGRGPGGVAAHERGFVHAAADG
eukprot:366508-Chlamydomonas_euryale.AAC.11